MKSNYKVITVENFRTHEVLRLYESPQDTADTKKQKDDGLENLLNKGFQVTSIIQCGKEIYLNTRLNDKVRDYLLNETGIKILESKRGTMPEEVYWESMCYAKDYRHTMLRGINRTVRRIKREGLKVHNPKALELSQIF